MIRCRLSFALVMATLLDRPYARPAGRDQRLSRTAASRRGLFDPEHHPLGEGTGMDQGVRAECHRRLHPERPRRRRAGGDRRRTSAALRSRDGYPAAICSSGRRSAGRTAASSWIRSRCGSYQSRTCSRSDGQPERDLRLENSSTKPGHSASALAGARKSCSPSIGSSARSIA